MRGVAGMVTDGGFRDSSEIAALAMPSFPSTDPSNLDAFAAWRVRHGR